MTAPLTGDLLQRAVDLMAAHGSERKAAKASGLSRSTFQHHLRWAAERGMTGAKPVLPGFAINQASVQRGPDDEQRELIDQRPARPSPRRADTSLGKPIAPLNAQRNPMRDFQEPYGLSDSLLDRNYH